MGIIDELKTEKSQYISSLDLQKAFKEATGKDAYELGYDTFGICCFKPTKDYALWLEVQLLNKNN